MPNATPPCSGESHPAATTSSHSGDSHPAVSQQVQSLVEEVVTWQNCNAAQGIPRKYGDDSKERNLGMRFAKLLLRREKGFAEPLEYLVTWSLGNPWSHRNIWGSIGILEL